MKDQYSNQNHSKQKQKIGWLEQIFKGTQQMAVFLILIFIKILQKSNKSDINLRQEPQLNQNKPQVQDRESEQQNQKEINEYNENQDHQNLNDIQKKNDEPKIPQSDLKGQFIPEVNQMHRKEDQIQSSLNQQKQEIQQQQQEEIVNENVEVQQEDSQQTKQDQQQQQQQSDQMEQQQLIGNEESENEGGGSEFIEKYNYLTENDLDLLNQIANQSYKGRVVEKQFQQFIGQVESIQDTIKNYFGRNQGKFSKQIKQLKKEIVGHINIRGDGNCFYTAFIYQYLSILLKDEQKKNQFINQIEELSAKIKYQNIKIEENKNIIQEFIWQFQQIKTKEQLLKQMRDPDYLFYQLTVIVFRRYFAHIYYNSQEFKQFGDLNIMDDLLIWEQECNNNEMLLSVIAEHAKLHITVYYIDLKNSSYDRKEYLPKQNNEGVKLEKIFLLFSPGHYQIAIPA